MKQLQARVEKESPIWKENNRSKIVRTALKMYYIAMELKKLQAKNQDKKI